MTKPEIKMKKYFYVLRPIFACEWIKKFNSMPPIEFDKLRAEQKINKDLHQTIEVLLANKKQGLEKDLKPRIKIIDDFVQEKLEALKLFAAKMEKGEDLSYEPLNKLFRKTLSDDPAV